MAFRIPFMSVIPTETNALFHCISSGANPRAVPEGFLKLPRMAPGIVQHHVKNAPAALLGPKGAVKFQIVG